MVSREKIGLWLGISDFRFRLVIFPGCLRHTGGPSFSAKSFNVEIVRDSRDSFSTFVTSTESLCTTAAPPWQTTDALYGRLIGETSGREVLRGAHSTLDWTPEPQPHPNCMRE